jgi:hypothetical protein
LIAFDVFISYSRKDQATAVATCAAFERAGIRCWIAPRDIPAGADWGAAIVEAIDNCGMFVLIFSARANESVQIRNEIAHAVGRGVHVVPVRIEDVMPTKALAYYMGGVQWVDVLTPPLENQLQIVVRAVRTILDDDARGSPRPMAIDADAPEGQLNQRPSVVGNVARSSEVGRAPIKSFGLRQPAIVVLAFLLIAVIGALAFREQITSLFVTTYSICVGEPSTLCPPGYIVLPCGSSVPRWADQRCSNHVEKEVSRFENFCGPILTRVQCLAPR